MIKQHQLIASQNQFESELIELELRKAYEIEVTYLMSLFPLDSACLNRLTFIKGVLALFESYDETLKSTVNFCLKDNK